MSFLAKSMLLLLLFFLSHHVHSSSKIKFLPGFEGPLPFEIETGYIGIGEEEEIQSFYYFFESENNPKEDPLLIWLSGGPGVSSINGLFLENGPLSFKIEPYNGTIPTLVLRTCSWTKMANILYLDQPVGAGFSYSKIPLGKTGDTDQVNKILEFLQKWLRKHPQFYYNHFYVGGDSYAGKIIPALVQKISKAHLDQRRTTLHVRHFQNGHTDLYTTGLTTTNDSVYATYDSNGHALRSTNSGNYLYCEPPINLQGYILGNPVTHFAVEKNYRIPFAHGMALISNELYESMNRICKGNYEKVSPQNKECLRLIENYHKCIDKINEMNILIPQCDQTIPDCYYHLYYLLEKWANNEKTREALHIRKRTVDEWVRFRTIPYVRDIESSVPYHKNNSISGYKSLIFSGDHDFQLPYLATEAWIKSLNYSIVDDWRPWMINDQIGGYTRSYANKMTFATVKGGGHTAEYKQHETFIMFQRWIKGQPL